MWFIQMVLQDPRSGREYVFELKDRIIRDGDLDGWKEIPVKPSRAADSETDENLVAEEAGVDDEQERSSAAAKALPGL